MRWRYEERIALSATPTLGHQNGVSFFHHFAQKLLRLRIADHRTGRDRQHDVLAGSTRPVRPFAMLATLGLPRITIRVVQQRGEIAVAAHDHVATAPAVAAIGTAHRREFFTTERGLPRSTSTCFYLHEYAIYEHNDFRNERGSRPRGRRQLPAIAFSATPSVDGLIRLRYFPCTRAHKPT